MIQIFDEWVRNDVGTTFIMNFETVLGAWMGLDSSTCVFTRNCGQNMIMEHNGDIFSVTITFILIIASAIFYQTCLASWSNQNNKWISGAVKKIRSPAIVLIAKHCLPAGENAPSIDS